MSKIADISNFYDTTLLQNAADPTSSVSTPQFLILVGAAPSPGIDNEMPTSGVNELLRRWNEYPSCVPVFVTLFSF